MPWTKIIKENHRRGNIHTFIEILSNSHLSSTSNHFQLPPLKRKRNGWTHLYNCWGIAIAKDIKHFHFSIFFLVKHKNYSRLYPVYIYFECFCKKENWHTQIHWNQNKWKRRQNVFFLKEKEIKLIPQGVDKVCVFVLFIVIIMMNDNDDHQRVEMK